MASPAPLPPSLPPLSRSQIGNSIFDVNGYRHTAAELLKEGDPSNLRVMIRAVVHRVLFSGQAINGERERE